MFRKNQNIQNWFCNFSTYNWYNSENSKIPFDNWETHKIFWKLLKIVKKGGCCIFSAQLQWLLMIKLIKVTLKKTNFFFILNIYAYRISSYSCRGNYSFLNS